MSIFSKALSFIPGVGPALSMGADLISGLGKAGAQNQSNKLTAAERQAALANQTSQANDSARGNAWKDLMHADYVMQNNNGYHPGPITSPSGQVHQLPQFGIARQPFSSQAVLGAAGMANEADQRLRSGPQLHTPDLMGMAKPSAWQKILNVAGPAMQFGSQLNFGAKPPTDRSSGYAYNPDDETVE